MKKFMVIFSLMAVMFTGLFANEYDATQMRKTSDGLMSITKLVNTKILIFNYIQASKLDVSSQYLENLKHRAAKLICKTPELRKYIDGGYEIIIIYNGINKVTITVAIDSCPI